VGPVQEASYAEAAGLQQGDLILRVGNRKAADWETALVAMMGDMVSTGEISLELQSEDGFVREAVLHIGDDASRLTEPGALFDGLGFRPGQPPAVIGSVESEGAAARGGLEAGDRVTAIDGEDVNSFSDLQRIVSARPDKAVTVEVVRNSQTQVLDVTIGSREQNGVRGGFLGVGIAPAGEDYWYVLKQPPIEAFTHSIERTWASTIFTLRMFGRMIIGDVSLRNISGPINIAQFAGDSAARGMNDFLNFLALISISLGVINLLPIPILDGGQIVYQTIEGIKGSPLSDRSQILGQQVGILALLLLMSFAFYNDIARLLGQ
jgi:regulator of sigma E protease